MLIVLTGENPKLTYAGCSVQIDLTVQSRDVLNKPVGAAAGLVMLYATLTEVKGICGPPRRALIACT